MNVMQAPKEIQRVCVLQVTFLRCLRRLCKMYNLLKKTLVRKMLNMIIFQLLIIKLYY